METQKITVNSEHSGERIDVYVSNVCDEISRSLAQSLIKEGKILIDGKKVKVSEKVRENQIIDIPIDAKKDIDESVIAENIPIEIIYEDDDILVINKPKNMVVHPAAGHESGTLVNALLYHCKDSLSSINGVKRPGIVHRIDRNTTGLLVVCKNDQAHNKLAEQLKVHSITRKYIGIVQGVMKNLSGVINAPIGRHPIHRKEMAINQKNGNKFYFAFY